MITRNKKQETRNYYDLFSPCQGFSFRERNESCIDNSCKGLQRNGELSSKRSNSIKCLGFMNHGTGKHQSNCVYSILGLSPTLCSSGSRMRQYTWILVYEK